MRLLELARMHAEVSVSGFEHALEIVEAQRIVGGQRADDSQANALMDQSVQLRQFRSARRRVVVALFRRGVMNPMLRFGMLAAQ